MKNNIAEVVARRILILDGAMGTMIQKYHLSEQDFRGERFVDQPGQMKGNNDLLCLTAPHIIQDIHRKYLEAGADIIETNTFNAQRISMADYHVADYCREINLTAAIIARDLADEYSAKHPDKPRFVAGSVGPTNKTCSMSPDVNNPAFRAITFDELADAYQEQMEALLEGGVDAILIETIFDSLNAKAAIYAAMEGKGRSGSSFDALHYGCRYWRTYFVRADIGGFLGFRTTCPDFLHWLELLFWCQTTETFLAAIG